MKTIYYKREILSLKKIVFKTEKKQPYSYRLGEQFQGWLMEKIPTEVAERLHQSNRNGYSISVIANSDNFFFTLNFLNSQSEHDFEVIIDGNFSDINLHSSKQREFVIIEKQVIEFPERNLNRIFYEDNDTREIILNFKTATSFKLNGENYYYPETSLIFANLMRSYTETFEGSLSIDNELLSQVVNNVRIVEFNIKSSYYPVHKYYLEGFIGQIKLRFKGKQTLKNYALMLLEFGAYAGIGVKTGMGMGHYTIEYGGKDKH